MSFKGSSKSSPVPVTCKQHSLLYQHSFFSDQLIRLVHFLPLNKQMKAGTIPGGKILFNRGNTDTKFLGDHFYRHRLMEVALNIGYDLFRLPVVVFLLSLR